MKVYKLFKKVWNRKYKNEPEEFILSKAIEELSELTTALAQKTTKNIDIQEIIDEVGDAEVQLSKVITFYGMHKGVKDRIKFKLKKQL